MTHLRPQPNFVPSTAAAPARRGARTCTLSSLLLATVAFTGCHHQQQVAYVPQAPPPIREPAAPTPHITTAARPPLSPEATPTAGFDDTTGKPVLTEVGLASWYGTVYHHRAGADGTIFDQNQMTAAHRTLPMGSTVRVTNLSTGQSVLVRITDRGPFAPDRVLDLSMGAAKAIGTYRAGVARVKIEAFAHPSADPIGRWCVQVGAFKSEEDALDLKSVLLDRYKTAKVIEFTGPTGHWVRINPAQADREHANQIARAIAPPDPNALPYVVRTN